MLVKQEKRLQSSSARQFLLLSVLLILSIASYLLLHQWHQGCQIANLSSFQIQQIESLINENDKAHSYQKLIEYLATEKNLQLHHEQQNRLAFFVYNFNKEQFHQFIQQESFQFKSYFWLGSAWVYLEVVFWSIFGSLLFALYDAAYHPNNAINLTAIVAIFFAPFLSIILFFVFDAFYVSDPLYISANKTILIEALLVGFFSSLVISFFNWLRLLLFGNNNFRNSNSLPIDFSNNGKATEVSAIIELRLDKRGIIEDVKNEILEKGFDNASVTLQHLETRDIITTHKKMGEEHPVYLANQLKPGSYIVRAMHSLRLSDNSIFNLFGEQLIEITQEEMHIELALKQYNPENRN